MKIDDHRRITDTALHEVWDTLAAAHRALSDTNGEPVTTEMADELGKVTFLMGLTRRYLRQREPDLDLDLEICDAVAELNDWGARGTDTTGRRDALIRKALAGGTRVRDLQDWTGLSRERIYQIRDSRR